MKTFLRDGYMMQSVSSVMENYPDIKIIVTDDGKESETKDVFYEKIKTLGHVVIKMPFDSGFGAKANKALEFCDREYVLHANDDFIFNDNIGLNNLIEILDRDKDVGIIGGRISGLRYEGFLEIGEGYIREILLDQEVFSSEDKHLEVGDSKYVYCDITSVYFLARREVFNDVQWDATYKIGGEHGDLFMDIKRVGWYIAFTPQANIEQISSSVGIDPEYSNYRGRIGWRPLFKKKHNITTYIGFYGTDYF